MSNPFSTSHQVGTEVSLSTKKAAAYALGKHHAKVAFGLGPDQYGSSAPAAGGAGDILSMFTGVPGSLGSIGAGAMAAHEAPEGRGLAHGLLAGGGHAVGGTVGTIGGGVLGGLAGGAGGALAGAIAHMVLGKRGGPFSMHAFPEAGVKGLGAAGALAGTGLGAATGALVGGLRGGYKGTQIGQNIARKGDPKPSGGPDKKDEKSEKPGPKQPGEKDEKKDDKE